MVTRQWIRAAMARLQISRTIEQIYRPSPLVDKFNGGKINLLQGWIRYAVYFTTVVIGPLGKYGEKYFEEEFYFLR